MIYYFLKKKDLYYFNFFITLFIFNDLNAQTIVQSEPIDFNYYYTLRCAGNIPLDFRTLAQDKFRKDYSNQHPTTVESGSEDENHPSVAEKKPEKDFFLISNFIVDQLLLSGKVLFGDTVSNYVNRVADKVLINQPKLRKQLRFYCLRSTEANAFSTNQGIIFVTLGLIARLENEAQLAFVLSHEIAHFEKKHAINKYLELEKVYSSSSGYKYESEDEKLIAACKYSQEQELVADSLGLTRLEFTSYSLEEAINTMTLLEFSQMPILNYIFNPEFLETPIMRFPSEIILSTISIPQENTNQKGDEYLTHPDFTKRRNLLKAILSHTKNSGTNQFIYSEASFMTIQKICKFEYVHLLLNQRKYCSALYLARGLQLGDSSSLYLQISIAESLYGMAKYKNWVLVSEISPENEVIEGYEQGVHYFFHKASAPAINMIAIRYLYNLNQSNPSPFIYSLLNDLTEEAVMLNNIHYTDLVNNYQTFRTLERNHTIHEKTIPDSLLSDKIKSDTFFTDSLKYYQVRLDSSFVQSISIDSNKITYESNKHIIYSPSESDSCKYYLLAFAGVADSMKLVKMFTRFELEKKEKKESDDSLKTVISKMNYFEYFNYDFNKKYRQPKNGVAHFIPIDTLIFVDPFYIAIDESEGVDLIYSETKRLSFCKQLLDIAKITDLKVTVLNPKAFGEGDVDKYNDMTLLNDWINEKVNHYDMMNFIPIESERIEYLQKKYNTDKICYTGIISFNYLKGRSSSYYYTFIYNMYTGKIVTNRQYHIKSRPKKGYINSFLYEVMIQMKENGKKEKMK